MSQQPVEAPPRPANEHQFGQAALVSLIPDVLRQAWPLLDLHDLKATMPAFTAAVRAIVQRYGQASAAGALAYYQQERRAASVPGRPVSKLAPSPADSVIESAVSWATTDLYGPISPEAETKALKQLDESVSQLVLNQGRDTIIGAVQQDKYARAWVRVTSPGACSFCQMLALRGAVYRDARAAGKGSKGASGTAFAGGGLDFKVHDNCRCHAEPVFTAYEPSAHMRDMQKTWNESTKGRSGNDARNAFRQALEGRPVTGTTGKTAVKPKADVIAHGWNAEQIASQIKLLEGLKDSPYRTERLAALRKLAGK